MKASSLLIAAGVVAFTLVIGGLLTKPKALADVLAAPSLPADVEAFLQKEESVVRSQYGITPGAEKRISWASAPSERSEYAVIYLHGFSATRQEIAPVPELVARALGANLFETRLAGHGQDRERLKNIAAEAWLEDGAEALAIGRALGDKLIVIGTSTGATIALAMANHPDFEYVESLVFISPNFGPAAENAGIATGPYGPQLTRLFAGEVHEWAPANDLQAKYWTTRYPTTSIVEMMRLVDYAVPKAASARVANSLLIYSPLDDVISVAKALAGFDEIPAKRKLIHKVDKPESLSPHVLTGDILAPQTSRKTAQLITAFLMDS